jgi:protein TonB
MDTDLILNTDYLDILYQGRNKNYGSYELRRNYTKRMRSALSLLIATTLLLSGYAIINTGAATTTNNTFITRPIDITPQPIIETVRPAIQPPPPAAVKPAIKIPTIIAADDEVKPREQDILPKEIVNAVAGTGSSAGDTAGIGSFSEKRPGEGFIETPSKQPERWVEQMPEPGYDVNSYLSTHIRYPDMAREHQVEGKLQLQFIIAEDGSITGVTVIKGKLGSGCEEEAIRVLQSMPKWKPGKQQGRAVKVYYILPVSFRLG